MRIIIFSWYFKHLIARPKNKLIYLPKLALNYSRQQNLFTRPSPNSVSKRVQVRNHSYKNQFYSQVHSNVNQTRFHMKGFAVGFLWKQRQKAARKFKLRHWTPRKLLHGLQKPKWRKTKGCPTWYLYLESTFFVYIRNERKTRTAIQKRNRCKPLRINILNQ